MSDLPNSTVINVNGLERELYRLQDEGAAPVIGYIPDLHVSKTTLNNTIYEVGNAAKGYDRAYVFISDVDDKTNSRLDFFTELGLVRDEDAELSIVANSLGGDLGSAFYHLKVMEKHGGIDNYLNMIEYHGIQGIDRDQIKADFENSQRIAREQDLEQKLQEVYENISDEQREEFLINNFRNRAFTYGATAANSEKLAPVVDEYNKKVKSGELDLPEIVLVYGAGNHDSLDSFETLRDFSDHTTVHHINDIGGAISLGKGNDAINFQLASNCYSSTPVGDTFGLSVQEVFTRSSPHTYDFTLQQGFDSKDIHLISDQIKGQSLEYQRLTFGEQDNTQLDFMLYHQEMGDNAPDYEHITQRDTHISNLGLIKHAEELVKKGDNGLRRNYSGHFHKGLEGYVDEEWGQVRNRFDSVLITKDGHQKINAGPHEEVSYDREQVIKHAEKRFQEIVEEYTLQMQMAQQAAANDDIYDEEKIAA